MIFLDANFLLRYLAQSSRPDDLLRNQIATDLLEIAERGEAEITTSEAILAEMAYILTSKNQYRLDVDDAARRIETIVRIRGMRLHEKQTVLNALELWTRFPKIGFVDALAAAYGHQQGVELATFDAHFDRIATVNRWTPPDK